jgi:hypothetical protein
METLTWIYIFGFVITSMLFADAYKAEIQLRNARWFLLAMSSLWPLFWLFFIFRTFSKGGQK